MRERECFQMPTPTWVAVTRPRYAWSKERKAAKRNNGNRDGTTGSPNVYLPAADFACLPVRDSCARPMWFFDRTLRFFVDNFPSWPALLAGAPLALSWSFACLWIAARLKSNGARTGYTRKTFHFLVFTTVALLQWRAGIATVCLFGGMCTLVVFLAVWRGPGDMLYEALAREKDEPRRTFFILVPYFTTLVGGLLSNILFGPLALAGYLVAGLGDAIGEPVGTAFGRHPYRVPSLAAVPATRTLEGSAAVFVASLAALALTAAILPGISLSSAWPWRLSLIALLATLVEAISPHGWDNATMQIVPTALVSLWLT